jgi:hypothetical protein
MASLEQVLASIPGLAGYQAQVNQNNATSLENVRSADGALGILSKIAAQAKAQRDMQLQSQYRERMSGATTDEQRAQIAMEAEGPKGVLTHLDTRARIEATKVAKSAELTQREGQFNEGMRLKWQLATDARDKANIEAQWKQGRLAFEGARAEIAGKTLQYNTGQTVDIPATPQLSVPGAPATPQPMITGQAPDQASAVAAINAGGGRPMTLEIPAGTPPSAPVALPNAAPDPVQVQPLAAPPNNMDARDLRLQQGAPSLAQVAQQAAPAVAPEPSAPVAPQMPAFSGSPKAREAAENKWKLEQSKASISGAGTVPPATATFIAKQYLNGNTQAAQGFARSTTARVAIANAIVDEAMKQGLSPEATNAKIADFAGTMAGSRTVGQRAANISLAATEAQEMLGIVKETSDKFQRTNFVPWNMALKAYDSGTGSPEIAAFGASVNALVNVYARAINPTGQPTVSDKEHARAVINTVQSPAQVEAVLGIIRRELEIAKKAPATVREATRQGIVGGAGGKPSADQFFK